MTRGRKPTAAGAELASAVLSDLAADPAPSRAAIADRHGITRQRVQQIAAAAGLPARARGQGGGAAKHRGAALLARLRELAAIDQDVPEDWLEDAAQSHKACAEIVEAISWARHQRDPEAIGTLMDKILAWATGRNPPELAAQVRAVVDAAGSSDDRTK